MPTHATQARSQRFDKQQPKGGRQQVDDLIAGLNEDLGLKVELENQVSDETRHKEEIERILAGWDDA
jgi:hypothetical protein